MNKIKKAYCRIFQTAFKIAIPFLPYRNPKIIGSVKELPEIIRHKKGTHVLLITDSTIRGFGLTARLEQALEKAEIPCTIYDKTVANPTTQNVDEALALYHSRNCDVIIGFGGGSSMDYAKAVGVRVARPKKSLAQMKGILRVRKKLPLLIAVPTTAGTGSETTLAAVIVDSETRHKYAINDFPLIPRYAVLDPKVTLSLPPFVTATTGLDALTHAVESYISVNYDTEETKEYCEEAVCAIMEFLPEAYNQADFMEAREEMLIASYKAGVAFTRTGVGNVHAIAHTIGGLYHVPHGVANAVVLPIVLDDYGSVVYEPLARLAELSNVATEGTDEEKAKAFIGHIRHMNETMGIPEHLPQIKREDVAKMSGWADKEANPLYPVPVIYDKKRFERIILEVAGK